MSDIAIFEGKRSSNYDDFILAWVPNYEFLLNVIARLLARESGSGEVLVAGCGTGNDILALLSHSPALKITGIDPSPEMVKLAREKLSGHLQVKLIDGRVSQLPANSGFDAATLILVLHFLPDDDSRRGLLRDIAERLKPGAPLILNHIFGSKEEFMQNLAVLRASLPKEIPEEDVESRLERIASQLHYIPESQLFALCEEAGFEKPVRFFQSSIYGAWQTRRKK